MSIPSSLSSRTHHQESSSASGDHPIFLYSSLRSSRGSSSSVSSSSILSGSSSSRYSEFNDPNKLSYRVREYLRKQNIESEKKVAADIIQMMNNGEEANYFEFNSESGNVFKHLAEQIDDIKDWPTNVQGRLFSDKIFIALIENNPDKAQEKILSYTKLFELPGFLINLKYDDFLMKIAPGITNLKLNFASAESCYGNIADFSRYFIDNFIKKFTNVKTLEICPVPRLYGEIRINCPKLEKLRLNVDDWLDFFSVNSPFLKLVELGGDCTFLNEFIINLNVMKRSNHVSPRVNRSIQLSEIEVRLNTPDEYIRSSPDTSLSSSPSGQSVSSSSTSLSSSGPSTSSSSTVSLSSSSPGTSSML